MLHEEESFTDTPYLFPTIKLLMMTIFLEGPYSSVPTDIALSLLFTIIFPSILIPSQPFKSIASSGELQIILFIILPAVTFIYSIASAICIKTEFETFAFE